MKEKTVVKAKKPSIIFRLWVYFRIGWTTYFGFIFAAINTLIVTYFLAIENYPVLQQIFPSFGHYVLITVAIGIPLLISIGYFHFKKTQAFKAESDVRVETNPHQRRTLCNTEVILTVIFRLNELLIKKLTEKELEQTEIDEMNTLKEKIRDYSNQRKISATVIKEIDSIVKIRDKS